MTELEKSLKNISILELNRWTNNELNPIKKEIIRRLRECKQLSIKPKFNEQVKVIKDDKLSFNGFSTKSKTIDSIIQTNTTSCSRGYAEYEPLYRQLVGNGVMVKHEHGKRFYGLMERRKGYTESSLIGNLGMVGGHINIDDPTIESGYIRECFEEIKHLEFGMISNLINLGYIREATDDISGYHLCVLYLMELQSGNTGLNMLSSSNETEKLIWIEESKLEEMIQCETTHSLDSWTLISIREVLNYYANINASQTK